MRKAGSVKGCHHQSVHEGERGTHLRVISDEYNEITCIALALRDTRRDDDGADQETRSYDERLHKVEDVKSDYGMMFSVCEYNKETLLTNDPLLESLILSNRIGIPLRLIFLPTEILDRLVIEKTVRVDPAGDLRTTSGPEEGTMRGALTTSLSFICLRILVRYRVSTTLTQI